MNAGIKLGIAVVVALSALAAGQFASKAVRKIYEDHKEASRSETTKDPVELSKKLTRAQFGDVLKKISDDINKTLPSQADSVTRIDSTSVGPGLRLTYMHTLIGQDALRVTKEQLILNLESQIKNGVCTMPQVRMFVENNVEMIYRYRRENGEYVGEISVLPSRDCARSR